MWEFLQADGKKLAFRCRLCVAEAGVPVNEGCGLVKAHQSSKSNLIKHLKMAHKNDTEKWKEAMAVKSSTYQTFSVPLAPAVPANQTLLQMPIVQAHDRPVVEQSPTCEPTTPTLPSPTLLSPDKSACSPKRKQKQVDIRTTLRNSTQAKVDGFIMDFIVGEMLPFSIVERESFRNLIQNTCMYPNVKVQCRKSFMKSMRMKYGQKKQRLLQILSSVEQVAATADMWSSHNK